MIFLRSDFFSRHVHRLLPTTTRKECSSVRMVSYLHGAEAMKRFYYTIRFGRRQNPLGYPQWQVHRRGRRENASTARRPPSAGVGVSQWGERTAMPVVSLPTRARHCLPSTFLSEKASMTMRSLLFAFGVVSSRTTPIRHRPATECGTSSSSSSFVVPTSRDSAGGRERSTVRYDKHTDTVFSPLSTSSRFWGHSSWIRIRRPFWIPPSWNALSSFPLALSSHGCSRSFTSLPSPFSFPPSDPSSVGEYVTICMALSLLPYAPQAVRVSYGYQALLGSWRVLCHTLHRLTEMVDAECARRALAPSAASDIQEAEGDGRRRRQRATSTVWWTCWEEMVKRPTQGVTDGVGTMEHGNGGGCAGRSGDGPIPTGTSLAWTRQTHSVFLQAIQLRCLLPDTPFVSASREASSQKRGEGGGGGEEEEWSLPPYTPGPSPWYDHLPLFQDASGRERGTGWESAVPPTVFSLLSTPASPPHSTNEKENGVSSPSSSFVSWDKAYEDLTVYRLYHLWKFFLHYSEAATSEDATPLVPRLGVAAAVHDEDVRRATGLPGGTPSSSCPTAIASPSRSDTKGSRKDGPSTTSLPSQAASVGSGTVQHPWQPLHLHRPLLEFPRHYLIREKYLSFRALLRHHIGMAAAMERKHKERGAASVVPPWREASAPSSREAPPLPPFSSSWTSPAWVHPFAYAGLFLSQDGIFTTRAASRVDAGVAFSTFYAPPSLSAPTDGALSSNSGSGGGRKGSTVGNASPLVVHSVRRPTGQPILTTTNAWSEDANLKKKEEEEEEEAGYREEEEENEEEDDGDARTQLCERPCPPGRWKASHHTLPAPSFATPFPRSTVAMRRPRKAGEETPSNFFSCLPLEVVESLLESYIPPFAIPSVDPTEEKEAVAAGGHERGRSSRQKPSPPQEVLEASAANGSGGGSANVFTPEMLLPLLPSYFVPLSLLGPRLPPGYTPAHVRDLFGRMVKHVEMVTLPPLSHSPHAPGPARGGGGGSSGVYLRLHEGLRECTERVVQFFNEKNFPEVCIAHQAADYAAYQPDPFVAHAFRALFLVPFSPVGEGSPRGVHPPTRHKADALPSSSSSSPLLPSRVIRNEWLSLREVMERAPSHLRDALRPLCASHTLLFFAQMQHWFQFSPDKGGLIRLAGEWALPSTSRGASYAQSASSSSSSSSSPSSFSCFSAMLGQLPLSTPNLCDRVVASFPASYDGPLPGVPTTGLGRNNTPTPLAVSEVAALLQQQGCVYVADLELSRTFPNESDADGKGRRREREEQLLALAKGKNGSPTAAGRHGVLSSSFSPTIMQQRLLIQWMMHIDDVLATMDEMEPHGERTSSSSTMEEKKGAGGAPRASRRSSPLFFSDRTKREIIAYYGTFRHFLACHHGEVFSLRLAPKSQQDMLDATSTTSTSGLHINENGSTPQEKADTGNAQQTPQQASPQRFGGSGFAQTTEMETADWAQQVPTEALLLSTAYAHRTRCGGPSPTNAMDPSSFPLASPRLMVEMWAKYEERQASHSATAATNGAGGMGSMTYGSASSAGSGGKSSSRGSSSSSAFLSSAAISALTLEQQLEYAISVHDRRRAQKVRRQLAQRNNPEAAYSDPELLFEALLRFVPVSKHVSLRFLLRHLPRDITDFLPSSVTTWLKRFEDQGKIQVFEYRFRHHIHLLRPGLPLPDGALRKHFTDDELVRMVVGDIQQRHPRPSRMAFLYGLLPLGAKEVIRTKHKTLQTFLARFPETFIIIAESKSERSSIVRVLQPPPLLSRNEGGRGAPERSSASQSLNDFGMELTDMDLEKEEEDEKKMMMNELNAELKESMRWK